MFNLVNGINQKRYRFNVDKYISNSKQVFTVQKPRVQIRLQPQPQQALAPVLIAHTPVVVVHVPEPVLVAPVPEPVLVAPVPEPVLVAPVPKPKPKPVPVPVQGLVSLKPGHTRAPIAAPIAEPVKNDNRLVSIKPSRAHVHVQAQAQAQAPVRSSNLIKLK
jgi:hypothetical protein